jgi:ribokinase
MHINISTPQRAEKGQSMKIAVVGSYGAGLTLKSSRMAAMGETLGGGLFDYGPGGKGSNQAVGAARLGADVSILTALGDDIFAEAARELWKTEGIDSSRVIQTESPTMAAMILIDDDGNNRILIAEGALNDLTREDVENFRDKIAEADLVLVSMEIPLDIALTALRIAREVGTRSVLNPAPAVALPDDAWDLFDVLTPNQTEGLILAGLAPDASLEPGAVLAALRDRTSASIVMTLGGDGCIVDDAGDIAHVPAFPPPQIVDTTGAGDSFSSALSVGLCEGLSIHDAAIMAAAAGSHSVTILGVINSLPSRTTLDAILSTGANQL